MARNTRGRAAETGSGFGVGEVPPMPGGTPGVVVQDHKHVSPTSVVSERAIGHAPHHRPSGPEPQPRRFIVTGGPAFVMYAQSKTRLPVGKVLSEASCDVEYLRRQGVMMTEVVAEPVAPPVASSVAVDGPVAAESA